MAMRLSNEQVREVMKASRGEGFDVGLRDLSYVLLSGMYEDPMYAFRAIFGDEPAQPFKQYSEEARLAFVSEYISEHFNEGQSLKSAEESSEVTGISFDEIKRGMEDDLKALIELRDTTKADGSPALDAKDLAAVVGRIADIRVKLTEKFGTTEKSEEQRVVVHQKFNDICWKCGAEIARRPL